MKLKNLLTLTFSCYITGKDTSPTKFIPDHPYEEIFGSENMGALKTLLKDSYLQPIEDHPLVVLLDFYFCQSCQKSVESMHSQASGFLFKFEYEVFYGYICAWSILLAFDYSPIICYGLI